MAFEWDAVSILTLYWIENVIVGALAVIKMRFRTASCGDYVREFISTYGAFTVGHLIFLLVIASMVHGREPGGVLDALSDGAAGAPLLAIQHLIVFKFDFLANQAYLYAPKGYEPVSLIGTKEVLAQGRLFGLGWEADGPLNRLGIMHLSILGGVAVAAHYSKTGAGAQAMGLLACWMAVKTLFEVMFVRRQQGLVWERWSVATGECG